MKKLVVTATVAALLFACSKNSTTTPAEPATPVSLISAHTWKIDTIGLDADKNGSIDTGVPGGLQACDLDNTLTFNADSTGVFDEGSLKCVNTAVQSVPFTWQFLSGGDSAINIAGGIPGALNGDINIVTLNDSSLIMSKQIKYTGDVNVNLIVELKK